MKKFWIGVLIVLSFVSTLLATSAYSDFRSGKDIGDNENVIRDNKTASVRSCGKSALYRSLWDTQEVLDDYISYMGNGEVTADMFIMYNARLIDEINVAVKAINDGEYDGDEKEFIGRWLYDITSNSEVIFNYIENSGLADKYDMQEATANLNALEIEGMLLINKYNCE